MHSSIVMAGGQIVLVSDDDLPRLTGYSWHKSGRGAHTYACAWFAERGTHVAMHRFILNAPPRACVDHINGNTLDNRRENIRLATYGQNQANRRPNSNAASQYRGVTLNQRGLPFKAEIRCKGIRYGLGTFASEIEAAAAYDAMAIKLYGHYARLNMPQKAA